MKKKTLQDPQQVKESALPACPDWLSPEAKKFFKRVGKSIQDLKDTNALQDTDQFALAILADCFARLLECSRYMQEHGQWYERLDKEGNVVYKAPNPQVSIANNLTDKITKMLIQFGLTPAARKKMMAMFEDGAANKGWIKDYD